MRNNEQAAKCGVQKGKKEKEGIKLRGNVKKRKERDKRSGESREKERKKKKRKQQRKRENEEETPAGWKMDENKQNGGKGEGKQ